MYNFYTIKADTVGNILKYDNMHTPRYSIKNTCRNIPNPMCYFDQKSIHNNNYL